MDGQKACRSFRLLGQTLHHHDAARDSGESAGFSTESFVTTTIEGAQREAKPDTSDRSQRGAHARKRWRWRRGCSLPLVKARHADAPQTATYRWFDP